MALTAYERKMIAASVAQELCLNPDAVFAAGEAVEANRHTPAGMTWTDTVYVAASALIAGRNVGRGLVDAAVARLGAADA